MPHQCVRCSKFYPDGANEIMKGCECGARLFFFVKKQRMQEAKEAVSNLTDDQKAEIESEVFDILGDESVEEHPVILDFESIRISEPGKYELDLVSLFKKDPIIYGIGEGKYVVDIKHAFDQFAKKTRPKKK